MVGGRRGPAAGGRRRRGRSGRRPRQAVASPLVRHPCDHLHQLRQIERMERWRPGEWAITVTRAWPDDLVQGCPPGVGTSAQTGETYDPEVRLPSGATAVAAASADDA